MINIAVFISGRGSNFHNLHQHILSGDIPDCKISVVFSNNPNAKGLEYASKEGIETIVISSKGRNDREAYDKEIVEKLADYNIDLICLAGYMRIVTPVLIDAYPNKIVNIHPALLPAFPGLHAQKQALEYGAKISGCTLHFVDSGVDTGPIIMQRTVPVLDNDTEDSLSARILQEEHKLYVDGLKLICTNKLRVEGRIVYTQEN